MESNSKLDRLAKWDSRFMEMCDQVATWSKDRSTKVGAVIIQPGSLAPVSFGYNGFPRGVDDDQELRHQRPEKYFYTEHAERNAIYNAAAHGHATAGCTMYSSLFPCADCARAIIQAGITRLVTRSPDQKMDRYEDTWGASRLMFLEAGVHVWFVDRKSRLM